MISNRGVICCETSQLVCVPPRLLAVNGTSFAAVSSLLPSAVSFSMSGLSRSVPAALWETRSSPCTARCRRHRRLCHSCLPDCVHNLLITFLKLRGSEHAVPMGSYTVHATGAAACKVIHQGASFVSHPFEILALTADRCPRFLPALHDHFEVCHHFVQKPLAFLLRT